VGKLGSTFWAQDSKPPTISLAEVKPILWRYWTALWESFPLLHTTYNCALDSETAPFSSSSSFFKIDDISGNLDSKVENGMFKEFGSDTILKWWAGLTSTSTCGSLLRVISLYSVLLILDSLGSRFNFNGGCICIKLECINDIEKYYEFNGDAESQKLVLQWHTMKTHHIVT